ncbi:hypothetical protein BGV05_19350, partial [Clostridioides difficile]
DGRGVGGDRRPVPECLRCRPIGLPQGRAGLALHHTDPLEPRRPGLAGDPLPDQPGQRGAADPDRGGGPGTARDVLPGIYRQSGQQRGLPAELPAHPGQPGPALKGQPLDAWTRPASLRLPRAAPRR